MLWNLRGNQVTLTLWHIPILRILFCFVFDKIPLRLKAKFSPRYLHEET